MVGCKGRLAGPGDQVHPVRCKYQEIKTFYFSLLLQYLYEGEVKVGGSEDCLYLSVYTPLNATLGDNLPVMFWIFGGYFNSGGNEW